MICEIDEANAEKSNSQNDICTVPKINSDELSYSDFFTTYLLQNRPCILLNISNSWLCTQNWLKNTRPDFTYLADKYKTMTVTVSDCNVRCFNAHETETITFPEYINYWKSYKENSGDNTRLLYLKDWHLRKNSKEEFYTVPKYFSSDWLNEYFSEKTDDDYKFVYMGPTGTWTPFHADVFTSFSWSINICGKKKWLLFPPGEEKYLKDNLGNLPYDVTTCNVQRCYTEIIQNAGEAIFVPSGWHHQVCNLDDTISVNHNWVNGCNILNMWESLIANLNAVKKEISDCKDMDGWLTHCQLMLETSYGLDFKMFYDFIKHIAVKRIKMLNDHLHITQFNTWVLGKNHALFDLLRIKEVLELFINYPDTSQLDLIEYMMTPRELMLKISTVLSKN